MCLSWSITTSKKSLVVGGLVGGLFTQVFFPCNGMGNVIIKNVRNGDEKWKNNNLLKAKYNARLSNYISFFLCSKYV